jgi:hypothetical protein
VKTQRNTHATRPDFHSPEDVTWRCIGVINDYEEGQEPAHDGFMYTVGLEERCGVELFCWIQASNGPVLPHPKWLDMILNQIGWDLINGPAIERPGQTFSYSHADLGGSLWFYVPAEPSEALAALMVIEEARLKPLRPDTPILEIQWDSPHKEPVGRLGLE